ncbi:MAG TPA: NAD-binding protein [Candidatus Cloacimonadota bacterium]|nr:NAD-binding protein [Candidatus Cloacimonadota bacterium]HPS39008.1 NAD-binding protein [Candidatus Cloacimonadota bacterium]
MKLLPRRHHRRQSGKSGHTGILTAETRKLVARFVYVTIIIFCLILLSSYLVWLFEAGTHSSLSINSFWDGIWWAVVTIATVGYGDKVPVTPYGRTVGIILILAGFTLLSVFTGLVASLFVEDKIRGNKGLKQLHTHHHIVICGWNNTAVSLMQALVEKGLKSLEIVIITNQGSEFFESLETQFSSLELRYVRGEATQEDILKRASVNTASQVIILADQNLDRHVADDRSIIIANTIHYMISKDKITVQLVNRENKNLLLRIGISNIIIYDDLGGYLLANNLEDFRSLSIFSQLLRSPEGHIHSLPVPPELIGKTYSELFDHIYDDYGQLLIGLMTKEPELEMDSIFSDNASAIDQFIKSTLAKSRRQYSEDRANIRWNPPRETIIQDSDQAIVMGREL